MIRKTIWIEKLLSFTEEYSKIDSSIKRYASRWAKDMRIYYGIERARTADDPDGAAPPLDRDIRFEHVSFAYEGAPEMLHDITLTIPAIDTAKYSGDYAIKYQVGAEAAQNNPGAIKVPLPTGSYQVKIVFE